MNKHIHFTHQTKVFMFSVMGLSILFLLIDSLLADGWITAALWAYVFSAIYIAYAVYTKDQFLKRMLVFAVVAGFAELLADAYLVSTGSLIYPGNEPMIWESPAYMPFSWTVVLMQLGYIGHLMTDQLGWLKSGIILMFIGAMMVPLYEYWAIESGWWDYQNVKEIYSVPLYVMLAEGLLMFLVPFFVEKCRQGDFKTSVIYGLLEGLGMLIAAFIAYQLLA